jgi:hypothetical protein
LLAFETTLLEVVIVQTERTRISPRGGGVNRRFKTFTSGLTNAE